MNTKFNVGQRVTYPVVHTADGNITGIAVSKAGVTSYAIGPKWYTEDDLKLTAEEKAVTEPVAESKPEPVKLYCVKDYRGNLTRGKIYEVKDGFMRYDDGSKAFMQWMDIAEDIKESWLFKDGYLVPLVRRPAKVGEWVYVTDVHRTTCNGRKPGDIFLIDGDEERPEYSGNGFIWGSGLYLQGVGDDGGHYLVLDGYKGDAE